MIKSKDDTMMLSLGGKYEGPARWRDLKLKPAALALAILAAPSAALDLPRAAVMNPGAPPVIAVLAADMGPYREALAGLREVLGADIPAYIIPNQRPVLTADTRVAVAFGIKALQSDYPPSVAVVSGLAPGAVSGVHPAGQGVFVHVSMTPAAGTVLSRLKELQPGLRRLGVLWSRNSLDFSLQEFRSEAEKSGISLLSFRAATPDDLPTLLRSIAGQADALWLPLDPAMLTSQNFETIKEYSLGNSLPLYVPTEKLVEAGATASVSASFTEIGRAAALAVNKILAQEAVAAIFPPPRSGTALNLNSAALIGIRFSERNITEADRVFR